MSPNEDQLRAALRHGEGENVDVDRLVQQAGAQRHQRRVRLLAVAAAVVAVAGIGAGGAVLVSSHRTDHRTALGTPPGQDRMGLGQPASRAPIVSTGQPVSSSVAVVPSSCPATQPQVYSPQAVPSAASRGSLFARPPVVLQVCAYFANREPVTHDGVPVSTVLTGAAASQVAASLDAAATTREQGEACNAMLMLAAKTLLITPITADGSPLPVIIAPLDRPMSCNPEVTNGTAARFNWVPSPALSSYVQLLNTVSPLPMGGTVSGSPPR